MTDVVQATMEWSYKLSHDNGFYHYFMDHVTYFFFIEDYFYCQRSPFKGIWFLIIHLNIFSFYFVLKNECENLPYTLISETWHKVLLYTTLAVMYIELWIDTNTARMCLFEGIMIIIISKLDFQLIVLFQQFNTLRILFGLWPLVKSQKYFIYLWKIRLSIPCTRL